MLDKIEAPAGVELSSYKRNRSIAITLLPGGQFSVRENGYVDQELEVAEPDLSKLLKTMIKREFPRSRKVRIRKFSHSEELDRQRKIL